MTSQNRPATVTLTLGNEVAWHCRKNKKKRRRRR